MPVRDASAAPVNSPVSRTTVNDPKPSASNCSTMSWREIGGGAAPRSDAVTSRTYAWTSKAICFNGRVRNENTRSGPPGRTRQLQLGVAQALDAVAKGRGFLEVQIRSRRFHVVPQRGDVPIEIGLRLE